MFYGRPFQLRRTVYPQVRLAGKTLQSLYLKGNDSTEIGRKRFSDNEETFLKERSDVSQTQKSYFSNREVTFLNYRIDVSQAKK